MATSSRVRWCWPSLPMRCGRSRSRAASSSCRWPMRPPREPAGGNSPIDGLNLDRCFPGDANGSPTEMIAHYIETELLPQCDAVIDICAFGWRIAALRAEHPHPPLPDPARFARASALMEAFNAPYSLGVRGRPRDTRALNAAAERCGIVALSTKLGGGATVTPQALRIAERGLRRALAHLGALLGGAREGRRRRPAGGADPSRRRRDSRRPRHASLRPASSSAPVCPVGSNAATAFSISPRSPRADAGAPARNAQRPRTKIIALSSA